MKGKVILVAAAITATGSWGAVRGCAEKGVAEVNAARDVNTLRELGYLTIAGTPEEMAKSAELDMPPDYTHIIDDTGTIHFDRCPQLSFKLHEVAGKDVLRLMSDASGPNVRDVTPAIVDEICIANG